MNVPEPARPDVAAMLVPLLREWALLREREQLMIRRIVEVLELASRPAGTTEDTREATVPIPGVSPVDSNGAAAPKGEHPVDPSWIDRTIDAVLKGVFSADLDPEADELPAGDLLLLRSGDTWVGVPWESVAGLGLSDDPKLGRHPAPISLRAILGMEGRPDGCEVAVEPYCLTWKTETGLHALSCEVLGGVVAAPAAAGRDVDLVWLPGDSALGGRLLPLVEYFASSRCGDREQVPHEARSLDDPTGSAAFTQQPADDAVREPRSAPSMDPEFFSVFPPQPTVSGSVAETLPAPPPGISGERPASPAPLALPLSSNVQPPPGAPMSPAAADLSTIEAVPTSAFGGTDAVGFRDVEILLRPDSIPIGDCHVLRDLGRSALVSVRYLPARVTIARALRAHGWFVVETADNQELPATLQRVRSNVVFAEAPERPTPAWMEALGQAREAGIRIVGVASRLRGASNNPLRVLGDVPRLLYPFQDAELERLLDTPVPPR